MPGQRKTTRRRGGNRIDRRPETWEAEYRRTGDHRCVSLAVLHAREQKKDLPQWVLDAMADDACVLWRQDWSSLNVRDLTEVVALLLTDPTVTKWQACKRVVTDLYSPQDSESANNMTGSLLRKLKAISDPKDESSGPDPSKRTKAPIPMRVTITPVGQVQVTGGCKLSRPKRRPQGDS